MTALELQEHVERLVAEAEAQGFPRHCSDPRVLVIIASAIRSAVQVKPTRRANRAAREAPK